MIPDFVTNPGSPHRLLPPGIHDATLAEIEARFCWNKHREGIFQGLKEAAHRLKQAGCKQLFVDGSFVTDKDIPSDFDGCWHPAGVMSALLDSVLLDFSQKRAAQKAKYKGELFISMAHADRMGTTFLDFFQKDKHTGDPKGIIRVQLDKEP